MMSDGSALNNIQCGTPPNYLWEENCRRSIKELIGLSTQHPNENLLKCTFITQGLKDHFRCLKDEIEGQHWIVSRDNGIDKVPLLLKNLTLRQAHSVFSAMGGRKSGRMTDEDLKVHWHSKHLKMLLASGKTEEEAHKEATVYSDDQFLEMKLKKVRTRTDKDLKVHWHSKHLKMLITTGMTEEEADKEAIVYANNRFLEYRMAVMSRNRASRKTYEEWYDGWHSEHLKMLLASGMTEEEAHKEATVYADDQIVAMTRKNMKGPQGPQRPPDILNCKHCLKLYMSERTLNEHLNKEGCHLNGDFNMDLLNTDGRIGICTKGLHCSVPCKAQDKSLEKTSLVPAWSSYYTWKLVIFFPPFFELIMQHLKYSHNNSIDRGRNQYCISITPQMRTHRRGMNRIQYYSTLAASSRHPPPNQILRYVRNLKKQNNNLTSTVDKL
jgi:hypothetical protein